jgi:uncharacterized protein YacL
VSGVLLSIEFIIYLLIYLRGVIIMSTDFIIRIIGMAVFSIVGVYVGNGLSLFNPDQQLFYTITFTLVGALFGLILTPYITTRPIRALRAALGRMAAETLLSGLIGLSIGLLTAALLAFPLSLLPTPFGKILPIVGVVLFAYFGVAVFTSRQADIANILSGITLRREEGSSIGGAPSNRTILLDTSVIIDGRVADIAKTGFLPGTLLIPRFVLNELQYIADSPDGGWRCWQNCRKHLQW